MPNLRMMDLNEYDILGMSRAELDLVRDSLATQALTLPLWTFENMPKEIQAATAQAIDTRNSVILKLSESLNVTGDAR